MKKSHNASRSSMSRRRVLQRAAGGAAVACCAPAVVPSSVFGAFAPNERINVGFIGLGNQSTIDLPAFLEQPDVQVVAVCDVNRGSGNYREPSQFLGREPGKKSVDDYYAEKTGKADYKACAAYGDFREVLGRKDIDAVVIITPDHWHGIMVVEAAKAGKDIYCEKPLSLTVEQGKAMVAAVRKYKRVFQVGSMYRSSPQVRFACELVLNGKIGQLKKIIAGAGGIPQGPGPGWQPMPVPDGFDYDFWLGPAPDAPYHVDRCLYRFRFIRDYSGGQPPNTGCHTCEIGQWGSGADAQGVIPIKYENLGAEYPEKGSLYNVASVVNFRATYANGVELICGGGKGGRLGGTRFEGTEGFVEYSLKGFNTEPASLKDYVFGPNDIRLPVSNPDREENALKYFVPDHARNFLDCMKTRKDPINPIEAAHRVATLAHLGNICMELNRTIHWDPVKQDIIGDAEASKMLGRPMRAPWTIQV